MLPRTDRKRFLLAHWQTIDVKLCVTVPKHTFLYWFSHNNEQTLDTQLALGWETGNDKQTKGVARSLQTKHLKGSNLLQLWTLSIFSVSFLTSNFLFSRMSYHKCHRRWSIKHARPSFGLQNIHTDK